MNCSLGCAEDRQFLGYKGAVLAEMTRISVPVPYGFVVSAECCSEFLAHHPAGSELSFGLAPNPEEKGESPSPARSTQPAAAAGVGRLAVEVSGLFTKPFKAELTKYVHQLERSTGRIFSGGSATRGKGSASASVNVSNPLLLSVRVSCNAHVDGLMESVLNVGLNDELVHSLAAYTGSPRFAYDAYRRFLQLYAVHVTGADPRLFEAATARVMAERNIDQEACLTTFDFQRLVAEFKKLATVPDDPWEQLYACIAAIYRSWDLPSVVRFRDIHGIAWVSQGVRSCSEGMQFDVCHTYYAVAALCTVVCGYCGCCAVDGVWQPRRAQRLWSAVHAQSLHRAARGDG